MKNADLLALLAAQSGKWRHIALDNAEVALREVSRQVKKAIDEGYLGDLYRTDYVVVGRGAFPIDMLRYTTSWPKGEEDTHAIERSFEIDGEYTITLTKHHQDPRPSLAEDRWSSKFRWNITKVIETVAL